MTSGEGVQKFGDLLVEIGGQPRIFLRRNLEFFSPLTMN